MRLPTVTKAPFKLRGPLAHGTIAYFRTIINASFLDIAGGLRTFESDRTFSPRRREAPFVPMLLVLTAGVPACRSTLTHQNVYSIRRAKRRSDSDMNAPT